MTRFVGTPLRGIEFSSPSDEAVSARVVGDSVARIRIDAGGRLTWSTGSSSGDVTLAGPASYSGRTILNGGTLTFASGAPQSLPGEVAGPGAEVQDPLAVGRRKEPGRLAPPRDVGPPREEAVQEVVARGDPGEHRADRPGGLVGLRKRDSGHGAAR